MKHKFRVQRKFDFISLILISNIYSGGTNALKCESKLHVLQAIHKKVKIVLILIIKRLLFQFTPVVRGTIDR